MKIELSELRKVKGIGPKTIERINTNRNFIGTEKDEEYFIIANNRIKELER